MIEEGTNKDFRSTNKKGQIFHVKLYREGGPKSTIFSNSNNFVL